jgi:hypothetical protein
MDESKIKNEVWEFVQKLNRVWTVEKDPNRLKEYFHKNMVAITATDRERREGGDSCVAGWRNFVEAVKIFHWKEVDPDVRLYCDGRCAVVTYYYDISFEMGGRSIKTGGRDMFVVVKEDDRWWVVADHFSPWPG